MMRKILSVLLVAGLNIVSLTAIAWDHPSHMATAAIAFAEIEKASPELADARETVFMVHPDISPCRVNRRRPPGRD